MFPENLLTEDQKALQRLARDFAQREILPLALELDQAEVPAGFPWDLIRKGSKLGFRTLALPAEWGGIAADALTQLVVIDELAYADVSCSKIFSQNWKICPYLFVEGTETQKDRYLPAFRDDDTFLLSLPVTEPNAGADVMGYYDAPAGEGVMATAKRVDDSFVLNGTKQWASHGDTASLYIVRVRTDPTVPASKGLSHLIIPRGTPGLSIGTVHDKMGWRAYHQAVLNFDAVKVPAENLLGGRTGLPGPAMQVYSATGNIEVPAHLVALARAALDAALRHANERRQGGATIIHHQAVAVSLAEMYTMLEAARSLIWRAASAVTQGAVDHALLRANRVFCAEAALKIALGALDVFGGYGVVRGMPIEKYVRDAIAIQHGEGGHKVLNLNIAKTLRERVGSGKAWLGN